MQTRRYLVALVALVATAAAGLPSGVGRAQAVGPPNFVVIVADDQRADTLEVMPKTEGWFATSGRRFTNGFVTTPLCCPSRASIFTGRYAHNHGVQDNRGSELMDQETTVQYYLRNAGYQTAIFGKYLNDWHDPPPHFTRWAIPRTRAYRDGIWNVNNRDQLVSTYSTEFIEEQALAFLADNEEVDLRPWLMFLTPQASHRPYTPEARYKGYPVPEWDPDRSINERNVADKPEYVQEKLRVDLKKAERTRRRQLRTLLSLDDTIDAVFSRLAELGELENTYVFYLSDNGYAWGDHRLMSSGALKNTPYTYAIRVPFLMYDPTLFGGVEDDRLVANIDVATTIVDLVPVPVSPDPPMDGRSLVGDHSREWLLTEWWAARRNADIPPWRSIRSADEQYVEYVVEPEIVGREYYDLTRDPFQLRNLLGDDDGSNDPADIETLHEVLTQYFSCSGSSCP